MTTTTKHTSKRAPAPVYFVDPTSGEVLALDLATASFYPVTRTKK